MKGEEEKNMSRCLVLILEPIENIRDEQDLRKKTLKITDFGLAKKQVTSSSTSAAGTYPWMSPECIRYGKFSMKSDVWRFNHLSVNGHELSYISI